MAKEAKGKKPKKNKPTSKKYTKYKIEGDKITSKAKSCPRCGGGVFLMETKNKQAELIQTKIDKLMPNYLACFGTQFCQNPSRTR